MSDLILAALYTFKPEIRCYPHFIKEESEDQRDCDISLSRSVRRSQSLNQSLPFAHRDEPRQLVQTQ